MPSATYSNNLRFIRKAKYNDTIVMRFISYQPNWQEQLLEVSLLFEVYKNGEIIKRIYDASIIAMISKRELLLLLEETGFKVKNFYGDYSKSKKILNHAVIEARKI